VAFDYSENSSDQNRVKIVVQSLSLDETKDLVWFSLVDGFVGTPGPRVGEQAGCATSGERDHSGSNNTRRVRGTSMPSLASVCACPYDKVTSCKLRLSTVANCSRECYSTMKWLIIRLTQPAANEIIRRAPGKESPSQGREKRESACIFAACVYCVQSLAENANCDRDSHSPLTNAEYAR